MSIIIEDIHHKDQQGMRLTKLYTKMLAKDIEKVLDKNNIKARIKIT